MKRYLNRDNKVFTLTMGAFMDYTQRIISKFQDQCLPLTTQEKELVKNLSFVRTYTKKTMGTMLNGLDDQEINQVATQMRKMEIVAKYKADAVKEYRLMEQMESMTHLENSEFLDLVRLALASCSICEEDGSTCVYKKIFLKHDIEAFNMNCGEGDCPYRI